MKRIAIRVSILTAVVALGLIAIAQARNGFQSAEPETVAVVAPTTPGPIQANKPGAGNPLRSRASLQGPGAPLDSQGVNVPRRPIVATPGSEIPEAGEVLAAQPDMANSHAVPHSAGSPIPAEHDVQGFGAPPRGLPVDATANAAPISDDRYAAAPSFRENGNRSGQPSTDRAPVDRSADRGAVLASGEAPVEADSRYAATAGRYEASAPRLDPNATRYASGPSNQPPPAPPSDRNFGADGDHAPRELPVSATSDEPRRLGSAAGNADERPMRSLMQGARPMSEGPSLAPIQDTAPPTEPAQLDQTAAGGVSDYKQMHNDSPRTAMRSMDDMRGSRSMLHNTSASEPISGAGRPGGKELEGSQAPSLTIEKIVPREIQVGKSCKFTIRVRNVGATPALNVEVHDLTPEGTTLVGTTPRAETSQTGELVWQLGTIDAGRESTVEMELMPTQQGEIGSVATVRFAAQAAGRSVATKPELVLRTTAEPKVMIGQQLRVNIEISNPGTGAATNVVLLENIPAGMSHQAGPSLEFEIGTLAPGEIRKLELMLKAEKPGPVEHVLIAQADANLEVKDVASFEVVAPELQVGLEGPKRRYLDRQATYTVSVGNPGTASARDVLLTTYLPKGMKFVKANNAGQYDAQSHSVSWSLEELPARQVGSVELIALPVEAGEQKLRVESAAQQGLRDTTEETVQVEGLAALMFTVTDLEDPVEVSGQTAYEIRVVNQGSKASDNVQCTVLLPQEMRAVSAEGATRGTVEAGRIVFAPIGRLAPKGEAVFQVRVEALQAGDQRVRVQVMSDEMQSPVTKEESTRVYADE